MKSFLILSAFSINFCHAVDNTTFALDRLEDFYAEFLSAQKNELSEVNLTNPSRGGLNSLPTPPSQNDIPVPDGPVDPAGFDGFLPIVIANQSGYDDDQVYVFIQGRQAPGSGDQLFIEITTATGEGQTVLATTSLNGSDYSYALSELPYANGSDGSRVIYIPQIDSALLMLSFENKLDIPVVAAGIQDPDFSNPSDPNYNTIWDQMEINFDTTATPQVVADATAVSFFSIPLRVYLQGATSTNNACGLTQSRTQVINYLNSCFSTVPPSPENAQWQKLSLYNGSNPLRVLSPGKSMAAASGGFDMNYLDNKPAYLYSYLSDIWYGSLGFYQTNTLSIKIPGGKVYSGKASGSTITLTSGSDYVTLGPIGSGPPYRSSTTWNIFSGIAIYSSTSNDSDAVQVSKAFEEAIIAGIVPTTSLIDASTLTSLSVFRPYYQVNANLSTFGQSLGPWYDLYSKALHACGLIYTYAYDEPLWPEVLLGGPYVSVPTSGYSYIGITILPSR